MDNDELLVLRQIPPNGGNTQKLLTPAAPKNKCWKCTLEATLGCRCCQNFYCTYCFKDMDCTHRTYKTCRKCHLETCVNCWMPNDITYLSSQQKWEIVILLWCFKQLKNHIVVPPKFVQYKIWRYIIKPEFVRTSEYLLFKNASIETRRARILVILQIYDLILENQHIIMASESFLVKCRDRCLYFAEIDNVWLDSYYKKIFGRELAKDVDQSVTKNHKSEVY